MNRVQTLSTLVVGLATLAFSPATFAQAGPAAPAAQHAQPAPVNPEAVPAKIALIDFEQCVFGTNEGQRAVADVQKKYEPQKAKIDASAAEIDSLKKQLQSATNLSDADRATRVRTIDTKEKQLQRDGEDASTAYNQDLQEAFGRVAQKVNGTLQKYVQDNGYTLLLNVGGQQSPVMWADTKTDITRAVIIAYNQQSGVAAPATPASAPAASHPAHAAPKK